MPKNQSAELDGRRNEYPSNYPEGYPELMAQGDIARDLQGIVFQVLEKWWLLGGLLAVGLITSTVYLAFQPRIYVSTATVQIERQDKSTISVSDRQAQPNDPNSVEQLNTVVEKFQCRPILALVLKDLGVISSNSLILLELDDKAFDERTPGNLSPNTFASNQVGVVPDRPDTTGDREIARRALSAINDLNSRISVKLRRNTRLVDITVSDRDPQRAATIANLMVDNYLRQDFAIKTASSKSQGEFFQAEFKRLAKKLQESEQSLQDYREKVGAAKFSDLTTSGTDELQGYQNQLTVVKAEVIARKSAYDSSLGMGTNVQELLAYTQIASDSQVQLCQSAIAQKEAELVNLKQQYREKNPKYILAINTLEGLKNQMASTVLNIRARIQESFRIPYENALTTQQGLERQLAEAQAKSLDMSQKMIHYNLLARTVASDRAMFEAVSQRANEMSVSSQLAPVMISLVGPAFPSEKPASPKVKLTLLMATFGSLALGVILILFLNKIKTTLRTVEDAEEYLQCPVLAAVPKLKLANGDFQEKLVLIHADSRSAEVELFRTLRASLTVMNSEKDHPRRTFVFTSSVPKEGKTFTSCNFAASLAHQGLRTVIFDLDLRRPRLEEFMNGVSQRVAGLTEVLQGQKSLKEVVQAHPKIEGLFWIAAGQMIGNPSELLSQGIFKNILESALKDFDRIVIDTPPLHPVKDALLVAGLADEVIVLVNGSSTPRKAVAKTLQWLTQANIPVAGVVLNLLPRHRKGDGYYYDSYYGYGYGRYAEDEIAASQEK